MSSPPVRTDFSGTPSNASAKARDVALFDFLMQRLAAGTAGAGAASSAELALARDSMGVGAIAGRNLFLNAGMGVASRAGITTNLSTSPQIGQVDMLTAWASGGAVSAGTITQSTSPAIGTSGYSHKLAGVTLTGAGVLSWRKRIESKNAVRLKNKNAVFQCKASHDVGSSVNYTVIIRKPTAADNYTSTTTIYTGSAIAVASSLVITIPAQSVLDVSNGIEVEVQAACGVVTTKNFETTEWQIEEASTVTLFEQRDVESEEIRCERFLPKLRASSINDFIAGGLINSPTLSSFIIPHRVQPRIAPTGLFVSASSHFTTNASSGGGAATVLAFLNGGTSASRVSADSSGMTIGQAVQLYFNNATAYLLFTGAELA